jgi:hypothetical protein
VTNPLDITGQCILAIDDGEEIRLKAQHDTIVVDLPNVRAGLTLLKSWPAHGGHKVLLARLQKGLTFADLDLQFQLKGKMIARLGARTRPRLVSHILRLGALELHPLRIIFAWWRRSAGSQE